MPFENPAGDSGGDWFADGLTEELITAFQRAGGVSVVARGASFSCKGWEADVRDIAVVSGAEYVVRGSLRRGTYPRGCHFAFVWDHCRHRRYDQALAEARRIAPYGGHMLAAAFAHRAEDICRLWLPSDGLADAVLAELRQARLYRR